MAVATALLLSSHSRHAPRYCLIIYLPDRVFLRPYNLGVDGASKREAPEVPRELCLPLPAGRLESTRTGRIPILAAQVP